MSTTIRPGHTIAVKTRINTYTCTAVDGDQITLSNGDTLPAVYCTPLEPYQDAFPPGTRVRMAERERRGSHGTVESVATSMHGHVCVLVRWDSSPHIAIEWDVDGLRHQDAPESEDVLPYTPPPCPPGCKECRAEG